MAMIVELLPRSERAKLHTGSRSRKVSPKKPVKHIFRRETGLWELEIRLIKGTQKSHTL